MTTRRESFAVITTHDRPHEFATCLVAIQPQVDTVIVIHHCPAALEYTRDIDAIKVPYLGPCRPNISAMWNLGLNKAEQLATGPYDVAVLSDDTIPAPQWFATVVEQMRLEGADGASEPRTPGSDKIAGWAFILNGDAHLRADEQFGWWHGDGDLQRQAGRWCFVPGITTPNTHAGETSRSQEAVNQIRIDGERFDKKWGHRQ